MSSLLDNHVLVLNQNYEPLSVCSARRAIVLLFRGKAQVVEERDLRICTVSQSFPLPSIVRLELYVHVPRKNIVLSKRNIMKRDGSRCQYCGSTRGPMTVDHIVPRTLGGCDTWENMVCACAGCNNRKGRRPPEEAGLRLIRKPQKPSNITFIRHVVGVPDQRWKPYLFME